MGDRPRVHQPRAGKLPSVNLSDGRHQARYGIYSRHCSESGERNLANTHGGARPKNIPEHVEQGSVLLSNKDTHPEKRPALDNLNTLPFSGNVIDKRIPLKKVLRKFVATMEMNLKSECPNVNITFEENNENLVCVIRGDEKATDEAESKVISMAASLKEKPVSFSTAIHAALKYLVVENEINEYLQKQHPDCVAEQHGDELILHGFDENKLLKASQIVGQLIIESQHILKGTLSDSMLVESEFRERYKNKVTVDRDHSCRFYFVGLEEYVKRAENELYSLIKSQHAKDFKSTLDIPKDIITRKYVMQPGHFQFFATTDLLEGLEEKFHVNISLQPEQYFVEIKGAAEMVEEAYNSVQKIDQSLYQDTFADSNRQDVQYFLSEKCHEYITSVGRSCKVLLQRKILYSYNDATLAKELYEKSIRWIVSSGKSLVLEKCPFELVQASMKVEVRLNDSKEKTFERQGNTILMRLPNIQTGMQSETSVLEDTLTTLLTKASEDKIDSIALPLTADANWTSDKWVYCILNRTVDWLMNSTCNSPSTVKLFTNSDVLFDCTGTHLEQHILECPEKGTQRRALPEICLEQGVLDQTQADVLVNTTAPNLDLSYGRVSAALLKAAGPSMQKECYANFRYGISRKDVAVSGGYNLRCKQVFHITIPVYNEWKAKENIENIREPMLMCLSRASRYHHKTIAFPAIGTGQLKYPPSVVISEMFGAVERFRRDCQDTSLLKVHFVVFPKDTELYQAFKRQHEKMVKDFRKSERRHIEPCTVEFSIIGELKNIQSCKEMLISKAPHISSTLDVRVTEIIHGVTRVQFAALETLHKREWPFTKEGIILTHIQDTNAIELCGRKDQVACAQATLKQYLEELGKMQRSDIGNISEDDMNIDNILSSRICREGNAFCFYDKNDAKVIVFAYSEHILNKIVNEIKTKLKSSSTKNNFWNLPDGSGCPIRDEEEMDTSIFEIDVMPPKKGGGSQQLRSKRRFSWSRDASEIDVYEAGNLVIRVYKANLLHIPVEAIVNAANKDLNHCGGVARDIAGAAGDALIHECETILRSNGPLAVASVLRTTAGLLDFKCVLHAVGPCWSDYTRHTHNGLSQCFEDLKRTVINCFQEAENAYITSIGMPAISSGIFRVPMDACAVQYAKAILEFSGKSKTLREIHLVDSNIKMIEIIHKTFSVMIKEGKSSPFPLTVYLQKPEEHVTLTEHGDRKADSKKTMKWTGRGRPKVLAHLDDTNTINTVGYELKTDRLVCSFSNTYNVHIFTEDIAQLGNIDAVVCSENSRGNGKGKIANALLETGGPRYRRSKETQFQTRRQPGEVITTEAGENRCRWIMHVVVSRGELSCLQDIYRRVLQETKLRQFVSIALPLLQAGDVGPVKSTELLLEEWNRFVQEKSNNGFTLYLVLNDTTIAAIVQGVFKSYIDEMNSNLSVGDTPVFQESTPDRGECPRHETDTSTAENEDCVICMDKVTNAERLMCGHVYCKECIDGYFLVKRVCPTCGFVCGVITGDQPDGSMCISKRPSPMSGFDTYKTIAINYRFVDGTQGSNNPRPGSPFKGISRTAYLPDCKDGREVCAMLKVAFQRRLVFTIGTSRTTGKEGVITWNDIHHKTDMKPHTQFGYPDDTYLQRVREELGAKGVTVKDIEKVFLKELKKDTFRQTITVHK